MIRNHWDSVERMRRLGELPTLLLSATRDEMLPPSQMQALWELHPRAPWALEIFEGAAAFEGGPAGLAWQDLGLLQTSAL